MEKNGELAYQTIESGQQGPRVLVLGALHGDEPCGPLALQHLIQRFDSGELSLTKGSLTVVPIANPEAYAANVRMVNENLNRVFRKHTHPTTREQVLANELCAFVDASDVVLDLHSSAAPGPVNLFIDYPTEENVAFAAALGAEFEILDWPKVYQQNPELDSSTSDQYAHEAGKIGILIECGQHTDPASVTVAEESVLKTLTYFDMLTPPYESDTKKAPAKRVRMTKLFTLEDEGDRFAAEWSHLQQVPEGTLIATRANGEEIRATCPSVIIFPKTYAVPHGEWFYIGELSLT